MPLIIDLDEREWKSFRDGIKPGLLISEKDLSRSGIVHNHPKKYIEEKKIYLLAQTEEHLDTFLRNGFAQYLDGLESGHFELGLFLGYPPKAAKAFARNIKTPLREWRGDCVGFDFNGIHCVIPMADLEECYDWYMNTYDVPEENKQGVLIVEYVDEVYYGYTYDPVKTICEGTRRQP